LDSRSLECSDFSGWFSTHALDSANTSTILFAPKRLLCHLASALHFSLDAIPWQALAKQQQATFPPSNSTSYNMGNRFLFLRAVVFALPIRALDFWHNATKLFWHCRTLPCLE
jgi:hypothetical protein